MAKKHVALRYAQIENEYLEMQSLLKELNDDLSNNLIDVDYYNSRVEMISEEVERVKLQYFFWAEAMFELIKPARKDKDFDTTTQAWYNVLQTKTKEILKDDGRDALATLKQVLKEGKIDGKK